MKTTIIECPVCYHRMDSHDMLDEQMTRKLTPQADDFTICSCCGAILRYEEKDVHVVTDEELELLEPDQVEMAKFYQTVIRSPDYQLKFKAGLITKPI